MKKEKPEIIGYTVEREFLADFTVAELINRIIQSHVKNNLVNENNLAEEKK